jgi:hypothetical protein
VVPVLDPNEKFVFDGMVSQLRDADPSFLQKIERLGRPRRKLRVALAVLLWTLAPVSIVLGGWTGLLMAVVAVAYGANLVLRRGGMGDQPAGRSSSKGRPGAPSL